MHRNEFDSNQAIYSKELLQNPHNRNAFASPQEKRPSLIEYNVIQCTMSQWERQSNNDDE
jgi:hypothetical protein